VSVCVLLCLLFCWSLPGCSALDLDTSNLQAGTVVAPELTGGLGWLNTDRPLSLKELRGKVVLLDFWTFCCINCMHVFPDLKKLEAKYAKELVVIGVHSAKFGNERDSNNIRQAVLRYGIEHPVVNDGDFQIWQRYRIQSWPTLVLIDPAGRLVGQVSGEGNYQVLDRAIGKLIEEFDKQGKISRKATSFALEKAKRQEKSLLFPGKITADADSGTLFISDSGHNRIVACSRAGDLLAVIGSGKQGSADGDYTQASFNHPQGLACRGDDLYVADTENHLLRHIDLKERRVTTIAGTGKQSLSGGQGGKARQTPLSSPWDLVLVGSKLYIAMAGSHQIWVLDLASDRIEPYAGSGREEIIDGPLSGAALAQPSGITTDGSKLYFADSEVSAVRSAELKAGGQVQTIVGAGLFVFGDHDGIGKAVRLQHPLGISWHDGKLYLADSYNHKIKLISPLMRSSKTLFGSGRPGLADGTSPQFSEPGGLCTAAGRLYIADTNNHAVRVADLNSKAVTTLQIKRLAAPALLETSGGSDEPKPALESRTRPNLETFTNKAVELRPLTRTNLVINVDLPAGFHLNPDTPLSYQVTQIHGDAIAIDPSSLEGKVQPPRLPISIPCRSGREGSRGSVEVAITIYYCSVADQGTCSVRSLIIRCPISVKAAALNTDIQVHCSTSKNN